MKKICYVVTIPITIRSFFIPQLKFLSENGFDVTVICSPDDKLFVDLGDKIHYIPVEIPRGISVSGSIKAVKALYKIFRINRYDLVQYSTPNASLYASIASVAARCRIRNYHCMGYRFLGFNGASRCVFKLIEKITCFLSTNIECVSYSNLDLGVKEKLFKKYKATVVFHGSTGGVDLERFDISKRTVFRNKYRAEFSIQKSTFVYGFVGRITKDKGINELIKAFELIENKESDTKLILIGEIEKNNNIDGSLLNYAQNSKNIIFIDHVCNIEEYYPMLDVLILPSYREGFGNVVIEAEAMGVPVIVSDIPGPRDAMENCVTGLLVPVQNVNKLFSAMLEIKKEYDAERYIQVCFQFAKNNFESNKLCEEILCRKNFLVHNS